MFSRHALLALSLVAVSAAARVGSADALPGPSRSGAPAPKVVRLEAPVLPDLSRKDPTLVAYSPSTQVYETTFVNIHTRDVLPVVAGSPVAPALLSEFLRCRVTGHTTDMAAEPLAVARTIARRFDADRVEVVSGYRSAKFNEMLRKKGHQVATRSRHILGHALDFSVPGVDARTLARAAAEIHQGGIGTYMHSGFIHVDIGPDRRWHGR